MNGGILKFPLVGCMKFGTHFSANRACTAMLFRFDVNMQAVFIFNMIVNIMIFIQ